MTTVGRIETFLEVAKQNSFAKAARTLGMTGPAASKQVVALEGELGVKLLNRTTRYVALTDEGAIYYERARAAMDELKEAAAHAQDLKSKPQGVLKISAPLSFGHMHLLPTLSGFAKKYPDVSMEVTLEDRLVDIMSDGIDVAIRIGVPGNSSLIRKHLSDCPILPVASPAYIRRYGNPQTPADLHKHRMIAYTLQGGVSEWKYKDKKGRIGSFRGEGVFRTNTAEMMLQAALDSVGIALLPIFTVDSYLRSKQLVRVLPDYTTEPVRTIFALTPPNRCRVAKVQLFLDWLTQACKAMPWEASPGA
ncbi:MAG: LysR substrate-binding domain-containing protein [Alphaproteobacteria bacterium]